MNKIDTLETLAQEVTASTINVLPKRCSYIRNWNSKCSSCIDVCKHSAIDRSLGRFQIKSEECTNCGACVAACPTSALLTTSPNQTDIVKQARAAAQNYGSIACFICERDAQEVCIDATKAVVLPCLNYLDEYLIAGLVAIGIDKVALLSRGCEGCGIDGPQPYFPTVVKSVKHLMREWGAQGKVKIFDKIPDDLCSSTGKHATAAGDRRAALSQAGGSVMSYVMSAVGETLSPEKAAAKKSNRNEQIVVKPEDVFPANTYRSVRIVGMLDRAGQRPYGKFIESRMWGVIELDESKCQHCGSCATMCATKALKYEQNIPETAGKMTRRQKKALPGTLTFEPSLCVNCGLCKDSCFRKALIRTEKIPAEFLDKEVVVTLFQNEKAKDNNRYGF